jgi:cytochrome P450 family 135
MRPLAFLQRMRERHGDVFAVRLLGQEPLLVVGDPELARQVFHAPADVLHAGEGNRRVLGWLYGEHSLILLDGERHMSHRRLLLPPFHGDRLKRQAGAIRALAEAHLDAWPTHGEAVEALPRLRKLALDVIMRVVLGEGEEERLGPLHDALRGLLFPPRDWQGDAPGLRRAIRCVEGLIDGELAGRRDAPLPQSDDVLSLLLEARGEDGSPLSDAEIRGELLTLIVAGSDTTAGALGWALERLARAPAALARATEEAAGGGGPYLDAVVLETLRMRPVVPMSARLVNRPFDLGGRPVPPGTTLAVSALLIHHRADIYPEPEVFRPERFLGRQPDTYTWIPFGGGVRRCIGASFALMEMRIVLSVLLARTNLRAPDPEPEGARTRANTMVPASGARIVLEPQRSGTEPRSSSGGVGVGRALV